MKVTGSVQGVKAAPSRLHSNVAPASELKSNVALVDAVWLGGPETMVVSGAEVSTVQV